MGDVSNIKDGEQCKKQVEQGKEGVCLVVEDDKIALDLAVAFFTKNNIKVEAAEDGLTALRAILADPLRYNIVFTDLHMPQMSGSELAEKIRASAIPNAQTIPLVLLSADEPNEQIVPFFSSFLQKPFGFSELIETYQSIVEKNEDLVSCASNPGTSL